MATTPANSTSTDVATPSKEVQALHEDWRIITALMGGTKAMRDAGERYLPRWPNEGEERYRRRLKTSVLFPAMKRTVITLAARPFSKPVTINDKLPELLESYLDDVDLQGRNLDQFGADAMRLALGHGFGGILVDHKRAPVKEGGAPLTKAEEQAAGLRPYMILVLPEQLLGWKYTVENGAHQLTMLRIFEVVQAPDGEFGTKTVEQVRVLEPGKYRLFRRAVELPTGLVGATWVEVESGVTSLKEIPFVPIYGERLGYMCGRAPLMDLAHLNVKHWQSQSDQDHLLHTARVPLLTLTGVEDTPDKPFSLLIGSSGAIKLPLGAEMKYVEHTGKSIEAGKQSLDDLKEEMRQSGAELLVLKPGPTTATEVASDNAVGMCDLQRATIQMQDSLNYAIYFMGKWLGIDLPEDEESVTLFMDFGAAALAETSAQLLLTMSTSGKLSDQTLISEYKRRGILASDVDYEDEQDLLAAQGPPPGADPALDGAPGGARAPSGASRAPGTGNPGAAGGARAPSGADE